MNTNDSHMEKPMIKSEIVTITPERAKELLGGNVKNRKVKQFTVDSYANDMRSGQWQVTGEPIIVNGGDVLLNGQHRLLACIKADTPFETLLVSGVEKVAQEGMDQGVRRSVSDVLGMRGEKASPSLSTVLASTYRYRTGVIYGPVSVMKAIGILESEPYAREVTRIPNSHNMSSSPLRWRTSVSGVLGMEVFRTGAGDFEQFARILAKPDAVGSNHPVFLLRERLIDWSTSVHANISYSMMLAVTFKAWNAWVSGERPKVLVWKAAVERFPHLLNENGEIVSEFGWMASGPGQVRGEDVKSAKLTESDVRDIRKMLGNGKPQNELAEMFGVSPSAIHSIANNKTWKHVE